MLTPHDYQDAIDVQSACNLCGVVTSFAEVLPRIMEETGSTHNALFHPITRLFCEQIKSLGCGIDYSVAFQQCKERAQG